MTDRPSLWPTVFRGKFLANSTGQFAEFRGSPRQKCPTFAAFSCLLFARELSFILLKNQFLDAGMALSCVDNIQRKLLIFF